MLSGVDRSSIIKIVAIYFVIAAILGLCGGLALFGIGGMAGIIGGSVGVLNDANLSPEAQQALNEAGGLAGIGVAAMLLGIVSIIMAPIMLVVAYGLFQRKAWARQGTILVAALSVLQSLFSLTSGFTSIITLIISGFVLYLFWTDEGIKMELSQ